MKKIFLLMMVMCLALSVSAQRGAKYPFGAATTKSVALTADTALVVTPVNTLEFVSVTADTNIVAHFTNRYAAAGHQVYLKVAVDTISNRTITFQTGIKGNTITMTKAKNYVIRAVHDGTQYLVTSSLLTD